MGIESPVHLLFLGAVALMVLGPKRLPELARGAQMRFRRRDFAQQLGAMGIDARSESVSCALGKGMREFRESIDLKSHDDER